MVGEAVTQTKPLAPPGVATPEGTATTPDAEVIVNMGSQGAFLR